MTCTPSVQTRQLVEKVITRTSIAGNKGFTLLELLVVLFIIGLTVSVATVSIGRLHEKTTFNAEARRLMQTMKHARNSALLERSIIELRVHEDGNAYWLSSGDETTSQRHSLPERYSLSGDPIVFFPKGNSTGGYLIIENGKGRKYRIEVDPVQGVASIKRL